MKKQFTTGVSKKVFTFLFAAIISCTASKNLYALPDSIQGKGAEITYQGIHDKKLAFNVSYKN